MDQARRFRPFTGTAIRRSNASSRRRPLSGFATPARAPLQYVTVVDCALDRFRQHKGQSGKLTATFSLDEMHYETIARLPVRAGAELKARWRS